MQPLNDQSCGWLTTIPKRKPQAALEQNIKTDWLIVGAGYTGLSAARKLAELKPNDRIVIIDANIAGEGASSRNSGYLVDSTLNDGHLSASGLENYLAKYQLNKLGMETVRTFVNDFQIDCDWNECGKYHASAQPHNSQKLDQFSQTLIQCGIAHDLVEKSDLTRRLGSEFYHSAVYTQGGVLLQPAKLVHGMIQALPTNIKLYENTTVTQWHKRGNNYEISTPKGKLLAGNLLVCTNGFLPSLGLQQNRVFPLTLTASLTRPLTDLEFNSICNPTEFGVLCAQPMGATFRVTQDQRIMIRNTAEAHSPINMSPDVLAKRQKLHLLGIQKRYPQLPTNLIEHTWSGVTCISGNSANVFEQLDKSLYVAGCYNGGGIGLATLFGEQLAFKACDLETPELKTIEQRPKPNRLPPQPFLRWGVKFRLAKDRIAARAER